MAHWLLKSEPSSWSFAQQIEAGDAGTFWNGVRNYGAKQHLMKMAVGEQAFFYHSGDERAIVGVVAISRAYYPDHTDASGKFGMVDLRAVRALPHPVTLDAIKRNAALKDMVLVNNSRLSVQPVSDAEWTEVMAMADR